MKKIFISFPYTHEDKNVTLERVQAARLYALQLINQGFAVFSPALVGHDLIHNLGATNYDLSFKYWEPFCYAYLDVCEEVHLLMFEGHDKSTGCQAELDRAYDKMITIKFIDEWK